LNLIDLSLKNVLLMARSWWTGRKRRRPEDEGAPVVHVFQGEGRRRLKRTEDRHRWLYFSCNQWRLHFSDDEPKQSPPPRVFG